jgi:penicillin amidase
LRRSRIVIVVLLLVPVMVIASGIGAVAWLTGRAMPQVSGTLQLAGLEAPAVVQRDANGIAQISAGSPHDLFMAQGFVHAQERMWQMEVWRHISAGRLAELFGDGLLDQDRYIRTLGWRAAAERDLAAASSELRAIIDAYAAGVNAWLDANRDRLGPAFLLTGARPEPWTALDTLAWGKVQAFNLGGNMDAELFRYLADARLGDPARTDELFPIPDFGPVIVPTRDGAEELASAPTRRDEPRDGGKPVTQDEAAAWRDVAMLGGETLQLAGLDASSGGLASDHGVGSNDWVVSPLLSSTGGALLANDPHLGISMPSVWYINGLHCAPVTDACPFDVAGVSFPGVPGVILGHNARIAWGVTNAGPDVQDLVIETVDPADPTHYIGPDGTSLPFTVRTEEIVVDGGETVRLEVRETIHGPILNDVDDRLRGAPLMAFRWTATHPDAGPDRTLEAFLGVSLASDFDEFRTALSRYGAPSQNFVYADVEGHIGYQMPGYVPVRSDHDDRGVRPVSGSDGDGEWVGRIPFEDMPWALDPVDGWIVTANNAVVDGAYPAFLGEDWDPGYRAERIIDLINNYGQDGLTVPEMGVIQNDTAPLRARDIAPRLAGAQPDTSEGQTLAARIADWDGVCDADSVGCAAYMAWEYRVLRGIVDDELGPLARDYVGSTSSWVALAELLSEPANAWWDDTTTPDTVETADLIILRALDVAGAELHAALGDADRWTWGRLHTATFQEATLGSSDIGPLEWYFNHGPTAVPGAAGSVNNTYYDLGRGYAEPDDPSSEPLGIDGIFTVTNLPSYRLIMDLSDLDGARIVITTGQSGNPFDKHYNDQVDAWRRGATVPLPFTAEAIERATVSTLTLRP